MSLIELLVTIGLMSIVVTGAFKVFQEGLQLFRANQGATDAQASAIRTLSRIDAELVNADPELVQNYSSPNLSGVVFASPLDDNGAVQFHPDTGKIFWQKLVCYYLVPNPSNPAKGKLYRKEERIPDESGASGIGRTGHTDVSYVKSRLNTRNTDYFDADNTLPIRLLGDTVSGFSVTPFSGEITDADGTKETLGGLGVSRDLSLNISVEAGDINDTGPDGYYIRVDSRVTPRG